METTLRVLVALGMGLLLILLRLDAERFGAAEFDEPAAAGWPRGLRRRLSWYVLGVGLVAVAAIVHPSPNDDLRLTVGDRSGAILGGLAIGALGAGQAVGFAWQRYGRIRLPPSESYPGAVLNAVATALVDEAAFRGILMGFLMLGGLDGLSANLVQALVYALATRMGAPGRSLYQLMVALGIGLVGGWLTLVTGGIGASFIAHATTRLGAFVATGHPGQVPLRGREVEEEERIRRPPEGWQMVDEDRPSPRSR